MAWWQREKRSSLENPSTSLSNPAPWLTAFFGGGPSASGISVNEETALGLTTVYSAISLLAETVAQLPLVLYRKTEKGRESVPDHPAARAMRRPFAGLTGFRWRELVQGHALAYGNGYAHVERNALGQPLRLVPQAPTTVRVELKSGDIVYQLRRENREYPVVSGDVLHIPAFGYDGLMGKSPIQVAREAIGLGLAAQKFGAEFFGNGASLGAVLRHPKSLGVEGRAKLKAAWEKLKGAGYQGVAVLEEGMDYTRIGIPPEDAQFIETRKFTRSEIAAIYKIPPHMLADLEKSSFNNIQEQSIQFLRFTMMPWLIKWEEELNAKLLKQQEQGQYFFKFTVQGLLRGTQKDRYDAYNIGLNGGWLNRNEVRAWEELDQVDGLDEFLSPMNMQGKTKEPDPKDEPKADPESDPEAQRLLLPVVGRFAQTIERMCTKATERGVEYSTWLDDEKTQSTVRYHVEPLEMALGDADLGDALTTWLRSVQSAPTAADVLGYINKRYWSGHEN